MAIKMKSDSKELVPSKQTIVVPKVLKGDTYLVVADAQTEPEDEFSGLYFTTEASTNVFLEPPYEPCFLQKLPTLNNTLSQCIDVMEVNIDGTGYELEPIEQGKEIDPTEEAKLKAFFDEPYPGKSFVTIRRLLRRQLESIGWAFLEVLRNLDGEIMGLRNVTTNMYRIVKLDAAIEVTKTISRDGKDVDMTMWERERRYAQKVGPDMIYYAEFGATRQLNRETGEWAKPGEVIPPAERATELLYFTVNDDVKTPYGIPRWINELPAILGSRKAEEQNLEFFDAGGVPPAIVFVQGGQIASDMSQQLKLLLSGQTRSRNRVVVVEAQATSGSLDTAGNVQVKVERFGAESVQDSLYQAYDEAASTKVREGFRIPAMFFGASDDYNFATALTAYMTAEAQVFQPERTEFDEIINKTILKAMEIKTCRFRSIKISLSNVDAQLAALGLLKGMVKPETYVQEISQIAGLTGVEYDEEVDMANKEMQMAQAREAGANANFAEQNAKQGPPPHPPVEKAPAKSLKSARDLMDLAQKFATMNGKKVTKYEVSPADKKLVLKSIKELNVGQRAIFLELVAAHMNDGKVTPDLVQLVKHHCEH